MNRIAWLSIALLLAGCGDNGGGSATDPPAATVASPARMTDAAQIARGAGLYKANCASCHGTNAEGAPNWHKPGPDGKYPAPPLNGTGHAWHHPKNVLVRTVREGTLKLGGSMPGWKDKLSDSDIEAAIAWFQSLWPEEVYKTWAQMDEKWRRK